MRFLISAFLLLMGGGLLRAEPTGRYNVLMISVDDLRPEIGCYGSESVSTPHMDRLAARGLVFERAYCQEAICMASRASLLTGMYPVEIGGYNFRTPVHKGLPGIVAMPEHFRNNGYRTVGINKDFHHFWEELKNWDEHFDSPTPGSDWRNYVTAENQAIQQDRYVAAKQLLGENCRFTPQNLPTARSFEIGPDEQAHEYIDSQGTALAISKLRELKDERFFLALGFRKPHLPFNAPKKYFDQFPLESIELPENMFRSKGASDYAFMNSFELRNYTDIPDTGPAAPTEQKAKELLRAYYACIAYVDDLLGQVLDELDTLGLRDQTIVVFWGDHGFKLGEHAEWGKHTNFEIDVRAPLIVSVPGAASAGARTAALTEFVDLYPTLVELCGLETPLHLEGRSFAGWLNTPGAVHREFAFSQYPRDDTVMGYTIRSDRYRYTHWRNTETGEILGRELFDHRLDPDENASLAGKEDSAEAIARFDTMIADKLDSIQSRRNP